MPSKTGLQKNLRRYGLFLIIGLCITALIWGAMSAPANGRQLLVDRTQVYTVGAGVHARCVFHFFSSGVLPLGGGEIRRGADFRQLIKDLRVHSHHCILCYRMGQQMRTAPVALGPQA